MKTKKIYWRLAFLLSLIPTIIWIIIFVSKGNLPIVNIDHTWLSNYTKDLPLWAFNRWFDIPGVFLIVFIFHNFPLKLRKIWNTNSKGNLAGAMYVLIVIICFFGIVGIVIGTILTNVLIALCIFIITTVITTSMLWVAQQIPHEWHKKVKSWIMQK